MAISSKLYFLKAESISSDLTSEMSPGLFSKNETDILTPFRMGEDVVPLIKSCIISKEKALGGQFDNILEKVDSQLIENRSMITIGG